MKEKEKSLQKREEEKKSSQQNKNINLKAKEFVQNLKTQNAGRTRRRKKNLKPLKKIGERLKDKTTQLFRTNARVRYY